MLSKTSREVKPLIEETIIHSRCDLRQSERVFLLVLSNVGCFARLKTIAELGHFTVRTAERARKSLLERGIIKLLGRSIYCLETIGKWCKAFLAIKQSGDSEKKCRVCSRARTRKEDNTSVSTNKIISDDPEREYVDAVKAYFEKRRSTKRSWSDKDTETALKWCRQGVPAHVAMSSIDVGIERKHWRGKSYAQINSLRYFASVVAEMWRTFTDSFGRYDTITCEARYRANLVDISFAYMEGLA